MYVAMDSNMNNGSDIQNNACGWLGIMIWISIVKSARNKADQEDDEDNLPHG